MSGRDDKSGKEGKSGDGAAGERQEALRIHHVDVAISRRVRELRESLGLTQRQAAADMRASEGRWRDYETGKRIPASRIWQFCNRYGIEVGELYAGLPFTIGPISDTIADTPAAAAGMAEDGATFEPAPGHRGAPPDDEVIQAINEAAAHLSPLERHLALAALRGMGTKKLKRP